jgi:hypothetical protein
MFTSTDRTNCLRIADRLSKRPEWAAMTDAQRASWIRRTYGGTWVSAEAEARFDDAIHEVLRHGSR